MKCPHENFTANVAVNRIIDRIDSDGNIGFTADVTIHCADCGEPFHFVGLNSGSHPEQPMVSVDATELRAPIKPGRGGIAKHSRFTVGRLSPFGEIKQ